MRNWSEPGNASPPQTFYQGIQPPPPSPPQWQPQQTVYQPVQMVQPAYPYAPPPPPDPRKEYNRLRRKEYNSMGLALLAQLGIAFAVTFLVMFGALFLIIFPLVQSGDLNPYFLDPDFLVELVPSWLVPLANLAAYLCANTVIAVLFCNRAKLDLADMFRRKSTTPLVIFAGFSVCLTVNVLGGILMQLINIILSPTGLELKTPDIAMDYGTAGNILMFVYAVLIAPITEELLFRGLILRAFQRTGRTFAIVASALLFGMIHGNFLQTVPAFLMGMVMGYVAVRCGSILPAIGIHMLNNLYAMTFQYLEEWLGETTAVVWIEYSVLLICLIGAIVTLVRERHQFAALNERKAPKGSWGLFFSSWAILVVLAIYFLMCLMYVGPVSV